LAIKTLALHQWQSKKITSGNIMKLSTNLTTDCIRILDQYQMETATLGFYKQWCPSSKDKGDLSIQKMREKHNFKAKSF
jgi:hypothetical protein